MTVLTTRNVIPYLLRRGVLTTTELLDRIWAVFDVSARNRNLCVEPEGGGSGMFVKQPRHAFSSKQSMLQREAACCAATNTDERLHACMPRLLDHAEADDVVVLERVVGSDLWDYDVHEGALGVEVARRLGCALGVCHVGLGRTARFGGLNQNVFPAVLPSILRPSAYDRFGTPQQSAGQAQVVAVMQDHALLRDGLQAAAAAWQVNSVIHGDVKLQNCLFREGALGECPEVCIVDWELADLGDAAWDVGSLFHSYLTLWVASIDPQPGIAVAEWQRTARYSGLQMHSALRAFWDAYMNEVDIGKSARASFLERAAQFAGARMVQTAYEALRGREALSARAVLQLQVAANVLAAPATAAGVLLGLREAAA